MYLAGALVKAATAMPMTRALGHLGGEVADTYASFRGHGRRCARLAQGKLTDAIRHSLVSRKIL